MRDRLNEDRTKSTLRDDLIRALDDLGHDPEPPEAGSESPLDDRSKAMRFLEIQQRHMKAMLNILPGTASEEVVVELTRICDAYQQLLDAGPPHYPLYTLDDVRARMADALHKTAQTYESLRRDDQALPFYRGAIGAYREAGMPEQATKLEREIAQIENFNASDFDPELQRLEQRLSELTEPSLSHVEVLVQLGELYMRGGDDWSSRERLEAALEELERLGYPDPGDLDAGAVLQQSMADIHAGTGQAGSTEIETLVAVRGLYTRVYGCLMQIWKDFDDPDDPDEGLEKAAAYADKLKQLEKSELKPEDLLGAIEIPEVSDLLAQQIKRIRP